MEQSTCVLQFFRTQDAGLSISFFFFEKKRFFFSVCVFRTQDAGLSISFTVRSMCPTPFAHIDECTPFAHIDECISHADPYIPKT